MGLLWLHPHEITMKGTQYPQKVREKMSDAFYALQLLMKWFNRDHVQLWYFHIHNEEPIERETHISPPYYDFQYSYDSAGKVSKIVYVGGAISYIIDRDGRLDQIVDQFNCSDDEVTITISPKYDDDGEIEKALVHIDYTYFDHGYFNVPEKFTLYLKLDQCGSISKLAVEIYADDEISECVNFVLHEIDGFTYFEGKRKQIPLWYIACLKTAKGAEVK